MTPPDQPTTEASVATFYRWPWTDTPPGPLFDAAGAYTAHCWTPILGPTATAALRLIAAHTATAPAWTVPLHELGTAIGIGSSAKVQRSLERLERFHLATVLVDGWAIRADLPRLSERNRRRLPAWLAHYETAQADHATARLVS